MTAIVAELKRKLAELDTRIDQLRADLAVADDQRKAVVTVIGVYDPDGAKEVAQREVRSDRSTQARRVTDLLKGRDLRRGILETLRDYSLPSPYAKITDKIASYAKMVDISVDTRIVMRNSIMRN
ncbi:MULTISPECIES: hypothetical protein [Rhizobium]|uniref:Uncharacterized protein n=1 Tax=Rhizobium favelukesii TaxID=348824 RepID=W6RQU6_9HYPH|nr:MULTISPECIES: hypothetical protein [Rhizobium]MCS0461906.1 hypothetical protein [Rhizobium favelukesii]UFS79489.1 hypothetical protein LPB79_07975 [Rhizobium sp. T136]CDM63084.1 hypothetical protein LPU83_pLPU83d_1714 [Rhizobium favelukesii]